MIAALQHRTINLSIQCDAILLLTALYLLGLGLVMVASASIEIADTNYSNPFYFSARHLVYLIMGILMALVVSLVPLHSWFKSGFSLLLIGILLLILVLVPGIGREVNGSFRWMGIGPISVQPSELVKLFIVIYLAGYLVRRQYEIRRQWLGFIKPMFILAVMFVLLLLEPDFGSVVVIIGAALGMLFLAGVPLFQFGTLIAACVLIMGVIIIAEPYRVQRLITFTNPWADQFNSGYQLTQALIAFGRGDWFGLGLGHGVQKLFYLPEAHTDFIFAVTAEELGAVGVLIVIALYITFIIRAFYIGYRADKADLLFGAYLAYGLGLLIGWQAFINIGVNTGLLPTKGLTLPFMSYGGNSLIVSCVAVALLLRVDYETRKKLKEI